MPNSENHSQNFIRIRQYMSFESYEKAYELQTIELVMKIWELGAKSNECWIDMNEDEVIEK